MLTRFKPSPSYLPDLNMALSYSTNFKNLAPCSPNLNNFCSYSPNLNPI